MPTALTMALKGLELLGISFPEDEKEQEKAFLDDIEELQKKITIDNISDLYNLKDCTDKEQLMIFKLYNNSLSPY